MSEIRGLWRVSGGEFRVQALGNNIQGVPREQKMLKGYLHRVIYHPAYEANPLASEEKTAQMNHSVEQLLSRRVQWFQGGLVFRDACITQC